MHKQRSEAGPVEEDSFGVNLHPLFRSVLVTDGVLLQSWGLPACHTAAACLTGQPGPEGIASIGSIEEGAKLLERTVLDAAAGRGAAKDILQACHLSPAAACSVILLLILLALVKCLSDQLLSFAGSAAEASHPQRWKESGERPANMARHQVQCNTQDHSAGNVM